MLLIALIFCFAACAPTEKTAYGFAMGSDYCVTYTSSDDLDGAISTILSSIEKKYSLQVASSLAVAINQAAAGESISLDAENYAVFSRVFSIAQISNYAFDPSILPLVKAWGFDPPYNMNGKVPPVAAVIANAMAASSCEDFTLNASSITKLRDSACLDLGGALKGYAAERVAKLMGEKGVDQALVYIGGTIAAVGKNYLIGVTPPRKSKESYALSFTLAKGEICATSGDYERYYEYENVRYHHIIDGKTGAPASSGVISATVISQDGLLADALATAAVVLGVDQALALFDECGVKGILITSDKKVIAQGVSVAVKDKSYEIRTA